MKNLILLILSCSVLSHASILQLFRIGRISELGLDTSSEESSSAAEETVSLLEVPVEFAVPDFAKRFFDIYYISSPHLNRLNPAIVQQINYLDIISPRRLQLPSILRSRLFSQLPIMALSGAFRNLHGSPNSLESQTPEGKPIAPPLIHSSEQTSSHQSSSSSSSASSSLESGDLSQEFPSQNFADFYELDAFDSQDVSDTTPDTTPAATEKPFEFPAHQQLPYTYTNEFDKTQFNEVDVPASFEAKQSNNEIFSDSYENDQSSQQDFQGLDDGSLLGDGISKHSYTQEDGTKVSEQTNVLSAEDGSSVLVKSGEYEYMAQNGTVVKVKWIADKNGFRILS